MIKGTELIGLPVVAYDTGEEIKKVKDLIFDKSSNFLGFLVDENPLLRTAQILPLHGIKIIGTDAIIASSQSVIVKADRVPEVREVLKRNLVLNGTKILTEEGRDLGTITDLYFDKQTGAIAGYEVVGGLFANTYSRLSFVPAPHNLKIGDDVAFVPRDIERMMTERVETSSQFSSQQNGLATSKAFAVVQSQLNQNQAHQSSTNHAQIEVNSNPAISIIEQILGKRVRQPVQTPEGLYIAAIGQIVTEQIIAKAQAFHQENDLIAAVCSNLDINYSQKINLQHQTKTHSLSEKITVIFEKLITRSKNILEQRQIKNAVGHPVNRVILDAQDNVILNSGELITYQAIYRARQAKVIEVLLSSVSKNNRTH